MTMAILDGDEIIYVCSFGCQKTFYKVTVGNQLYTYPTGVSKTEAISATPGYDSNSIVEPGYTCIDANLALYRTKVYIQDLIGRVQATDYEMHLTTADKSNFRYNIATLRPYKGNRVKDKPLYYELIRKYLMDNYKIIQCSGAESDDSMATAQTKYLAQGIDSIIVSRDKDLDMVPGRRYNTQSESFYTVTDPGTLELASNRKKALGTGVKWFYAQMLLGDSADNIPGIGKYGAVKVVDLLKDLNTEKELFDKVKEIYYTNYKDNAKEAFVEVGKLLWMSRDNKIWTPPYDV